MYGEADWTCEAGAFQGGLAPAPLFRVSRCSPLTLARSEPP